MANKREFRVIPGGVKRAAGDKAAIEGYAAVFNSTIELGDWFGTIKEVVRPGAFARTLNEGADVRCLWNHDPNYVLGRTKSKTLTLREDSKGLWFRCDMPKTQFALDLHESIDRGDIDGCSFGFSVTKQNWIDEKAADGTTDSLREILDVDLYDAGPVCFPAYPQTSVDARTRQLWPEGMPEEVRSHTEGKGVHPDAIKAMRAKVAMIESELGAPSKCIPGIHLQRRGEPNDVECECECSQCVIDDCAGCICLGCEATCNNADCRCAEHDVRSVAGTGQGRTIHVPGTDIASRLARWHTQEEWLRAWKLRCDGTRC